jgi:hypothetical protein
LTSKIKGSVVDVGKKFFLNFLTGPTCQPLGHFSGPWQPGFPRRPARRFISQADAVGGVSGVSGFNLPIPTRACTPLLIGKEKKG